MTRWEYLTHTVKVGGVLNPSIDGVNDDLLNKAGQEGWELVDTIPIATSHGQTVSVKLIFKRPSA